MLWRNSPVETLTLLTVTTCLVPLGRGYKGRWVVTMISVSDSTEPALRSVSKQFFDSNGVKAVRRQIWNREYILKKRSCTIINSSTRVCKSRIPIGHSARSHVLLHPADDSIKSVREPTLKSSEQWGPTSGVYFTVEDDHDIYSLFILIVHSNDTSPVFLITAR